MRTTTGLVLLFTAALTACDLTQEVEIDLPEYTPQPVVECYLEPGQPFRLLLTRSFAFFDPFGLDTAFLETTLLQGAEVSIRYNGTSTTLTNTLAGAYADGKAYNYVSPDTVPETPGITFELDIVLADGKQISGTTTMLSKVRWDSVVVQRNPDDTLFFRVLAYMTDDLATTDFYRLVMSINRTDTVPELSFLVNDELNETGVFVFGTGYQLKKYYRAYNTIVHLPKEYHDFLESVQLALAGSENPFQQPSPIKSNVGGSANPLGIFTCLAVDRDTTQVK